MSQTTACKLSRSAEGLHFAGSNLTYRITGLLPYNLDRLRVTLKASQPETPVPFHIDTLDLYQARCREMFTEACAQHLKAQQAAVMAELMQIIAELEAERITMRERGSTPAAPVMSEAEKKEALEALKSKDLLRRIVADFEALGFIGEKHNKLLGYIAAVSRKSTPRSKAALTIASDAG